MQCAEGAPGPRTACLGAACPGTARREQARLSVHVHTVCFTPLTADCHATPQGLSSKTNLPNSPESHARGGSEGEGHGVSLLLLSRLQSSAQSP